jgi:hypothetical protein
MNARALLVHGLAHVAVDTDDRLCEWIFRSDRSVGVGLAHTYSDETEVV